MESEADKLKENVDGSVREFFSDGERGESPTENQVREKYAEILRAMKLAFYPSVEIDIEDAADELTDKYLKDLEISRAVSISFQDEETKPWLLAFERDNNPDWFYWNRYKRYLLRVKKWAPTVVSALDNDTRTILDLMANPQQPDSFERKGLVMAPVQSGKTSNYTALICRAADVGYKIIIVMAGVHNMLRNQTQARLEEGFAGFNINVESGTRERVGVGHFDSSKMPNVCTSRSEDFTKKRADGLKGLQSDNTDVPWLFVVKKNSNSLSQVYEWLKNCVQQDEPLLLIDDEADNASINGKYRAGKRVNEVTRINGQIRNILGYFKKRVYVGYTATPFANILIDPEIELEKFGADLFPKSFIYTLGESTDYFGARKVFGDYDEPKPLYLRFIEDAEQLIPAKHKSDFQVSELPHSLKQAIQTFIVATAIRYLRGDELEHSTMMVNVSPYVSVQRSVFLLINCYVEELQDAVKSWGAFSTEKATAISEHIREMQNVWETEYKDTTEFDWQAVQEKLSDVLATVQVVIVNSNSGEILNYEEPAQHVIAVGGYRLSRGLTLEGLVVSYYKRNSKAYDTLMQMARWFGYRPGYEDLCRIWMTDEAAGWYSFIAEATENLVDQIILMRQQGKTPRDFVLNIQRHPDTLIITARNKMGLAQRTVEIDYNNSFIETVAIWAGDDARNANFEAAHELASEILHDGCEFRPYKHSGGYIAQKVPLATVENFVSAYQNCSDVSPQTDSKAVLSYIEKRKADGELPIWDVLFAGGGQDDTPMFQIEEGKEVQWERRRPGDDSQVDYYLVGAKRRVSGRGVTKAGMTDAAIAEAEKAYEKETGSKENCPDRFYNLYRTEPLLVIHPILFKFDSNATNGTYSDSHIDKVHVWPDPNKKVEAIGWTIAFPYSEKESKPVEFVFNQGVLERGYIEESDDDYEDDSDAN